MLEVALALALVAGSSVPYFKDTYSVICKGEQANGFDWREGEWVKANYKPSQYVIVKNSDNKCFQTLEVPVDMVTDGSEYHSRSVCLNVRVFGEKYSSVLSERCSESYLKIGTADWVAKVVCQGGFRNGKIVFAPDGRFQSSSLHSDVSDSPKDGYKDSLATEVGRCAVIS